MARYPALGALLAALIVTTFAPGTTSTAAGSSRFAGQWRVTEHLTCANTPANHAACWKLFTNNYRAYGLRGTVLKQSLTSKFTVNSRGRFTVHTSMVVTELAPNRGAPASCGYYQGFGTNVATGTCYEELTGSGHIASGVTGLSDFLLDKSEWTDSGYGSPVSSSFNSVVDLVQPAVPGVYGTRKILKLIKAVGIKGITARIVVKHTL